MRVAITPQPPPKTARIGGVERAASIAPVVRLQRGMLRSADWNLVVTAYGGRRHDLVHALRPIVRLKRAGYAEVMVGRVDDVDACLAAIAARAAADAVFADEILARVIPVSRTFALAAEIEAQLAAEVTALAETVGEQSFHVRVERRGHKRILQSDTLERRLGTALVESIRGRGAAPRVTFDDPDLIVAVELIGDYGGLGLVPRALRGQYRFVRL
jgi:tRNA(Ser,Leu) C12 N-acetylase TAN1